MNRRKALIVAKYEFWNTVRKKAFILTTLLLPLFVAVPVYLSASLDIGSFVAEGSGKIGYVDALGFINETDGYVKYSGLEDAKEGLKNGSIDSFFVLKTDYFDTGNVTIYTPDADPLPKSSGAISQFLLQNLLVYAHVDEKISRRITQPAVTTLVSLDDDGTESEDGGLVRFLQPYILSIVLLLSITLSSSYLMQGIGEEKESRTGELLLSSISADQLLKGKIIGYGAVGLLQISLWGAMAGLFLTNSQFAPFLSGIKLDWIVGLAVVYYLLGYALFSVSIACAAAISPTAKEAQQTSSIFTLMAAVPMMFSSMIIMAPDSFPAKALTYFPYTAPVITMMRISLTDVSPYEIGISVAVMIATTLFVMSLAGKIFRMGMLMQGKRASIREIIGFAREK
ncbi:MAG: ABC transporter permease [Candidatus Altiarchaeia archaeon]